MYLVNESKKQQLQFYIDFLLALTEKEIKARYKHAALGFFWMILNPLLQMIIIGFIFSLFINIPNYFLFLFSGLLPWQFFSLSLSKTTPCFIHQRTLLKKAKFPKETIPISIILSNYINLIISLILLILFLLLINNINMLNIILLLPALVWLLIFTIGLSLFTSSLNVRFRDINFFINTFLTLWFYASPILYNLHYIPQNLRYIFRFNPLSSIFELFHLALANQGTIDRTLLLFNLIGSLLIVFIGIIYFRKANPFIVDWV